MYSSFEHQYQYLDLFSLGYVSGPVRSIFLQASIQKVIYETEIGAKLQILLQYYAVIPIEENTVQFVIQEVAVPLGVLEIDERLLFSLHI